MADFQLYWILSLDNFWLYLAPSVVKEPSADETTVSHSTGKVMQNIECWGTQRYRQEYCSSLTAGTLHFSERVSEPTIWFSGSRMEGAISPCLLPPPHAYPCKARESVVKSINQQSAATLALVQTTYAKIPMPLRFDVYHASNSRHDNIRR